MPASYFWCKNCRKVYVTRLGGMPQILRGVIRDKVAGKIKRQFGLAFAPTLDYRIQEVGRDPIKGTKRCPICSLEVSFVKGGPDDAGGKVAGKRTMEAFDRAKNTLEVRTTRAANIQVGDFLSELATAIRFRMRLGQPEGDWMEEPERAYTDGMVFAEELTTTSTVKLQITLTLDASISMWKGDNPMQYAGPAFIAIDKTIRKAIQDLPEGSVTYAPFIFHGRAFKIPQAFMKNYAGTVEFATVENTAGTRVYPGFPTDSDMEEAKRLGQIPAFADARQYPLSGGTKLTPLFKAIKEWEETEGSPDGVRLDIIITDGLFTNEGDDITNATKLQEERNGKLRTVLLNFCTFAEWANRPIPERCSQYAVTPDSLTNSIREILSETIRELL
jgi:hypothetical protein